MEPISPTTWITKAVERLNRRPMIYVAHPVAARDGETLATCLRCKVQRTYSATDRIDLHAMCEHDDPVHSTGDTAAIVRFNVERALRWWRWLDQIERGLWTMPWVTNVLANHGQEFNADRVTRGLADDCEIVRRCDAVMLVGPRVSHGMKLEAEEILGLGLPVFRIEAPWAAGEPPQHHPTMIPWRLYV